MIDARFPIQYVVRPQTKEHPDFRGYAGRIASGIFRVGDDIKILPSGFTTKIKSIHFGEEELDSAIPPQSVTISLEGEFDISRGDMLVKENNVPKIGQDIDIMICWLGDKPMIPRGKYILKHTSNEMRCMIQEIVYKVDINTMERDTENVTFNMNDIGRIKLRTTKPVFFDSYRRNRITGSVILVDEATNNTVCAGMIV
jgi:sulfate adenylyltransferase subunit 1